MPLCPLLVSAALDVAPEEPTIILPEVSVEVVVAFIKSSTRGIASSQAPA